MKQKNKIVEVYGIWFLDLVSILVSFIVGTYIRFGNFKDMGDRNSFLPDISFQKIPVPVKKETVYRTEKHEAKANQKMHIPVSHIPEIPKSNISADNK